MVVKVTKGLLDAINTHPKYKKATRMIAQRVAKKANEYVSKGKVANESEGIELAMTKKSVWRGHEDLL